MKLLLSNNALLLIWVGLMASSFVVSENLLPFANPIASTGLRFILASVLMLPFVVVNYRPMVNRLIFIKYGFISLFLVLFFLGLFEALKTTTAMRTSVIYTLVPLISLIFTYIALKLTVSKTKLMGFILGSMGATWVLLAFNNGLNFFVWYLGDSIFALGCISLSLHVVLVKKWGAAVPPAQGAFYIMFSGGLMLLPFMGFFGELNKVAWMEPKFWEVLLYLTIFTTMATFFLQQHLVQKVGPNHLLAFTYLIPILVVIPQGWAATSQLKDSLAGILITLLALYLISRDQKIVS